MKSIQSKILFVVIAALVVITLLVSYVAVSATHEIMHKDANRILKNLSQKEAAEINDMLNDFVKSSSVMEHYAEHELTSTEALRDAAYLAEYTQKLRHLFDEVAANTSGTSSYYFCFSPELTEKTSGFYISIKANGEKQVLSEAEFAGLSLISNEELIEYSNSDGSVGGSWVEPHPSRFTREMVVSFVMPVYSGGEFIGLLGFNMDFNYLLNRVNDIGVYEYGDALLLAADKNTYYNLSTEAELEEYTAAVTPLTCGLSLELRAAYKDIQSGIRPMLTYIVIAFIAVFVLAVLYTLWMTHKIVTPLKKLTKAAESISMGAQNVDLVVLNSKDEIGTLSRVLSDAYSKMQEYSSYIKALAYRDSLTGIKNSTAYIEAIADLDKKINVGKPNFGVLVADINNLKQTNDSHGHDVGNELIVHTAKILTDVFKSSAIYRIGGDEFVVILSGKDLKNYHALMAKVDAALAEDYITVDESNIPVSVAKGVAIFDSSVDNTYSDVFGKADHAMYINKEEMKALPIA